MERRIRPRVFPNRKAYAFINGSSYPSTVADYSAAGIGVKTVVERLKPGKPVSIDIVVDEELCACSIPGTICWTLGSSVGIKLEQYSEHQIQNCHDVETKFICR